MNQPADHHDGMYFPHRRGIWASIRLFAEALRGCPATESNRLHAIRNYHSARGVLQTAWELRLIPDHDEPCLRAELENLYRPHQDAAAAAGVAI